MLSHIERYTGYEAYVLAGVDQETAGFYRKGHMATLIGGKGFNKIKGVGLHIVQPK